MVISSWMVATQRIDNQLNERHAFIDSGITLTGHTPHRNRNRNTQQCRNAWRNQQKNIHVNRLVDTFCTSSWHLWSDGSGVRNITDLCRDGWLCQTRRPKNSIECSVTNSRDGTRARNAFWFDHSREICRSGWFYFLGTLSVYRSGVLRGPPSTT